MDIFIKNGILKEPQCKPISEPPKESQEPQEEKPPKE